jgi:hypothetical protein
MIDALDEALRQFLVQELPIENNEVDIAFDQPDREWSARLSRPTLNLFLYDLRENKKLRSTQPVWEAVREPNGAITQKRRPIRMDMRYLVTAWTTDPEDEHHLLTRATLALFRYPHLPPAVLPEALLAQPMPIPLEVAQPENLPNTSDVWSALENTLRAGIVLQVTLALDPDVRLPAGPPVRARELRFGPVERTALSRRLAEAAGMDVAWTIGGRLRSKDGPLEEAEIRLVERDQPVAVEPDGRFVIGNLRGGEYTLRLSARGRPARQHRISVPAPDYDLEL